MKNNYFILSILLCMFTTLFHSQSLVPYRKGNLWGYAKSISKDIEVVVPPIYDTVYYKENLGYAIEKNKKIGVVSILKGDSLRIIPPAYDNLRKIDRIGKNNYSSNQYYVKQNGKEGVIDDELNYILPIEYKEIFLMNDVYFF